MDVARADGFQFGNVQPGSFAAVERGKIGLHDSRLHTSLFGFRSGTISGCLRIDKLRTLVMYYCQYIQLVCVRYIFFVTTVIPFADIDNNSKHRYSHTSNPTHLCRKWPRSFIFTYPEAGMFQTECWR